MELEQQAKGGMSVGIIVLIIILALIALAAVGVSAYYFLVVKKDKNRS